MSDRNLTPIAVARERRVAWARFYSSRSELDTARLHAAELAAWIETLGVAIPRPVAELIATVRRSVPAEDLARVERFVRYWRTLGTVPDPELVAVATVAPSRP